MHHFLAQTYNVLADLKAYPVIGAFIILAVFALVAGAALNITGKMIRSVCKDKYSDLEGELRSIVRKPIWAIFLLFGVMLIFEWLNLLPEKKVTIESILETLILLIVATTLNRVLSVACKFWNETKDRPVETIAQIEKSGKWLLVVVACIFLLSIWRVNLAPLLASAGFAGIVVAVAAKDSLSNLFGGLALTLDAPFKPGDYIVLDNGERGKVVFIGGRSTIILTRDDVQISIPNSIMANTRIKNESAPEPRHRIRVEVAVAYGSDFDQVEKTLTEIAVANHKISAYPEPRVRFRTFGDSGIHFELLCWTKQPEYRGTVVHQLGKTIYNTFAEKNITIPFPQRDVHLQQ